MRKSFKIKQYLLFCSVLKRCERESPCYWCRKPVISVLLFVGTEIALSALPK